MYLQFCSLIPYQSSNLTTSEQTLLLFTLLLALQHQSSSTIQAYLASVHHLHLSTNHLTEYTTQHALRVQQVLCGIKRQQACGSPLHTDCQLPLTSCTKLKKLYSSNYTLITAFCCGPLAVWLFLAFWIVIIS